MTALQSARTRRCTCNCFRKTYFSEESSLESAILHLDEPVKARKRGIDQCARLMQVDNDMETAESNFAAVLATREKLTTILRKHPCEFSACEAIESIALLYDVVGLA